MLGIEEELGDPEVSLRQLLGRPARDPLPCSAISDAAPERLRHRSRSFRPLGAAAPTRSHDPTHRTESPRPSADRRRAPECSRCRRQVTLGNPDEFGTRMADAREVSHRRHIRIPMQPRDDVVRHFPGPATGAVGHRCERRPERLEVCQCGGERLGCRLRLGREELEAIGRPGGQDVGDLHDSQEGTRPSASIRHRLSRMRSDRTLCDGAYGLEHELRDRPAPRRARRRGERCTLDPASSREWASCPNLVQPRSWSSAATATSSTRMFGISSKRSYPAWSRRVVDPARLTWIERSVCNLVTHPPTARSGPTTTRVCSRVITARSCADRNCLRFRLYRTITGAVKVKMPLVGGKVEGAIVGGLRENGAAQVGLLNDWNPVRPANDPCGIPTTRSGGRERH